jgi:hypothetical protein
VRLENALGSLRPGSAGPREPLDGELRARLGVAEKLAALDLAGESRVREPLRERLAQALEERRAHPVGPARRRPWVRRRPVLATCLGIAVAVALLLAEFPVGEGRSVGFGRATNRWTPDGQMIVESPELKTEELSLGGQTVVWDPDPDPGPPSPHRLESSALDWEEDGVSYSLMGRSLTREEAVDLFLSLRPLDERP